METSSITDEGKTTSRNNSIKELRTSQSSLKSTKSLEKTSNTTSNYCAAGDSLKSDKSNHDNHNNTNKPSTPTTIDVPSLKVPNKIIANWKHACDRTKDKTKDLLKRWRTLPEIEGEHALKHNDSSAEKIEEDDHIESGWSVHVWSNDYQKLNC